VSDHPLAQPVRALSVSRNNPCRPPSSRITILIDPDQPTIYYIRACPTSIRYQDTGTPQQEPTRRKVSRLLNTIALRATDRILSLTSRPHLGNHSAKQLHAKTSILARETRARMAVQHERACFSNTQASLSEANSCVPLDIAA
jgi:hypothetical protein